MPAGAANFYLVWINTVFNLINYLTPFAMGVLFYLLFKNKKNNIATNAYIKTAFAILFLFLIYSGTSISERLMYAGMTLLFLCFIYYPGRLSFLENKLITRIGVCSYFLYLIHEHIAVLMINSWGKYFYPVSFILPLLIIIFMIVLSILYTDHIDKRIIAFLKKDTAVKKNPAS
jgi:peptidoglycan/LPS O-acetylase OafA/YrhL